MTKGQLLPQLLFAVVGARGFPAYFSVCSAHSLGHFTPNLYFLAVVILF